MQVLKILLIFKAESSSNKIYYIQICYEDYKEILNFVFPFEWQHHCLPDKVFKDKQKQTFSDNFWICTAFEHFWICNWNKLSVKQWMTVWQLWISKYEMISFEIVYFPVVCLKPITTFTYCYMIHAQFLIVNEIIRS